MELGKQVKAYRLEMGWSQRKLAAFLGISRPTVIRLELGQGKVSDLIRAKIEKRLPLTQNVA